MRVKKHPRRPRFAALQLPAGLTPPDTELLRRELDRLCLPTDGLLEPVTVPELQLTCEKINRAHGIDLVSEEVIDELAFAIALTAGTHRTSKQKIAIGPTIAKIKSIVRAIELIMELDDRPPVGFVNQHVSLPIELIARAYINEFPGEGDEALFDRVHHAQRHLLPILLAAARLRVLLTDFAEQTGRPNKSALAPFLGACRDAIQRAGGRITFGNDLDDSRGRP